MTYYDEYEPEPKECWECEEKEKTLDHVRDHFTLVLEMLFGKVFFDKVRLENSLDEICNSLEMPEYTGQIVVDSELARTQRSSIYISKLLKEKA